MKNDEGSVESGFDTANSSAESQFGAGFGRFDDIETTPADKVESEQVKPQSSTVDAKRLTNMDVLGKTMASALAETMKYGDRGDAQKQVVNLVRTFAAVASLPEGAKGLRVGNVYYSFEEYALPSKMAEAMPPARIQVSDHDYAINFADNKRWNMTIGKVLNPSEVAVAIKALGRALRMTIPTQPLSRKECGTIDAWAEYAIVGGKVSNRKADRVCFLTTRFLEDQYVPMEVLGLYLGLTWFGVEIG